jgi:YD repeat-containing protein
MGGLAKLRHYAAAACALSLLSIAMEPAIFPVAPGEVESVAIPTPFFNGRTPTGLNETPSPQPLMGNGSVNWTLSPPLPVTGPMTFSPQHEETPTAHVYVTNWGRYTFPKAEPHNVRLETAAGPAVLGAWFQPWMPSMEAQASEVVGANESSFVSHHEVVSQDVTLGSVETAVLFTADTPPKFSMIVEPESLPPSAQIAWIVITRDTNVTVDGSYISFAGAALTLLFDGDARVEVGGPDMIDAGEPSVILDWSDAPEATLAYAGRIDYANGVDGIVLLFPVGVLEVDPSAFGTSTSTTATAYSSQRKVLWTGDRYWAFYAAGTEVAYRTTADSVVWSAPRTVMSGTPYSGFDVDSKSGLVAMAWYSSRILMFQKGVLYTDSIAWDPAVSVATHSPTPPPPAVSIAADGSYWVAGEGIYRSPNGNAGTWVDKTFTEWSTKVNTGSAISLLPLTGKLGEIDFDGWMYALLNYVTPTTPWDELLFGVYNASSMGWSSALLDIGQPGYNTPRYHSFSATIMGILAHVAYTTRAGDTDWGDVWYLNLGLSDSFGPAMGDHIPLNDVAEAAPLYPSVTWGPPGNVYVFWRAHDQGDWDQPWAVRNVTVQGPFPFPRWSDVSTQFSILSGQKPSWITTPKAVYNRVPLVWRDVGGACSACNLVHGSIPLLDDFSASAAHPWARVGLGGHVPLIGELTDFLNPANGQLIVSQVDAGAPGRGLDLALSRDHVNPYAFQGSRPVHYETNPAVPMGLGWQINIPWKSWTHLYLVDGERYLLSWSQGRMVNRLGTPFTLYLSGSYPEWSYDLFFADGTRANFSEEGALQFLEDPSGNRISFIYDQQDRLTSIADTMGRTASLAYYAGGLGVGQLSSLTYAGRTVTFQYVAAPNGGVVLSTVTYPLGRVTTYTYDAASDYLLKTVLQPWGASTTYTYKPAPVGTEATGYLVTNQTVKDGSTTVRSRAFDYTLANGWSLATKITLGDGTYAKGYQVVTFASPTRGMTTVTKDVSGQQMGKTVQWYGDEGRVGQTDVYLGDAEVASYSTLVGFDNWTNPYYTRTPISPGAYHETFASYANTDSGYAFRSPGILQMQSDGKVLHENFDRHDLSRWIVTVSGTSVVALNNTVWDDVPPSLKIQRGSGSATAKRTFATQSGSFLFTTSVRVGETSNTHSIVLGEAQTRIELQFASDGWVRWKRPGGASDALQTYEADRWYGIWLSITRPPVPSRFGSVRTST